MQTSYSLYMAAAFPGMLADMFHADFVSKVSAEDIPFGRLLSRGTGDDVVKLPASAGDITGGAIGISVHTHKEPVAGVAQYVAKETIPVLKKGRIWVQVEDAVADGGDVHVRYVAGTGVVGGFLGAAVSSETAILPNAKYVTSASAGGLAVVEIHAIQ